MFGTTIMLAGLTRIIEVCFFSASSKSASEVVDDDNHSDHTLAEPSPRFPPVSRYAPAETSVDSGKAAAAKAFRHLPAFVRRIHPISCPVLLADGFLSCSSHRGTIFSFIRKLRHANIS